MSYLLVRFLLYISFCIFIVSCEQRDFIVEVVNKPPILEIIPLDRVTFSISGKTTYDSIRMQNQQNQNFYEFQVLFSDINENIQSITIDVSEKGHLVMVKDGQEISVSGQENIYTEALFQDSTLTFKYFYRELGFHKNILVIRDVFGKSSVAGMSIEVFDNLPPHLAIEYSVVNDELQIDFSKSYDLDNRYKYLPGSETYIEKFEVTVSNSKYNYNKVFETTEFFVRDPLPHFGRYKVSIHAVDNNGAKSETSIFDFDYGH